MQSVSPRFLALVTGLMIVSLNGDTNTAEGVGSE